MVTCAFMDVIAVVISLKLDLVPGPTIATIFKKKAKMLPLVYVFCLTSALMSHVVVLACTTFEDKVVEAKIRYSIQ